jgi:hypothetical protein
MRFDFADVRAVLVALDHVRADGPNEGRDRRYRAAVRTTLEAFPEGLAELSCRLTARDVGDAESADRLPLEMNIEPVMPTPPVHTFELPCTRAERYEHRLRVLGAGAGESPEGALRDLRRRGLVVQLELRRAADGRFEPLLWATDTQVYTEGVPEYDPHREPDTVDKGVQARLLGGHDEFVTAGG